MSQMDAYGQSSETHFVTFSDVVRNTKYILKTHGKYLFPGYLLIVGLIKLSEVVISGAILAIGYFFPTTGVAGVTAGASMVAGVFALMAVSAVLSFFFYVVQLGLYRPFQKIVMSGQEGWRLPKSFLATVFERFGALLIFSLLSSLGIVIGLLLCIVPGIAFGLVSLPAGYLVATRNIGTIDAYNETFKTLQYNAAPIIITYLVMIGVSLVVLLPMKLVEHTLTPVMIGSIAVAGAVLLVNSLLTFATSTVSWFLIGSLYATVFDGGPPQMRRFMDANIDDGIDDAPTAW